MKKIVEFNGKSVELSEDENGGLFVREISVLPAGDYTVSDLIKFPENLLMGRKLSIKAVVSDFDNSDSPIYVETENNSFWLSEDDVVTLLEEESV